MLTFQEETFSSAIEEIKTLMHGHWEEVASNKDTAFLEPNWDSFTKLEEAGALYVLTARDDGALVGYIIHVVVRPLHYASRVTAHDDAHYLLPAYRKGMNGIKMIKAAEDMLKRAGVNSIAYHSKAREDINKGPVFQRLGYKPEEIIYKKEI
ncbi:hypothetical protein GAY31_11445 [Azospirillum brasilense]|nr:hypothetical protein [Azospirillum brasilense]